MNRFTRILLLLAIASPAGAAEPATVAFERKEGELAIRVGERPFALYRYADEKLPRPYFCQVHEPGGLQVTRQHPPGPNDAQDHPGFHPGLWLAFGDLSGHDCWRLKAPVAHDGFADEPRGEPGKGMFAVRNKYLAADGKTAVCRETCRYTLLARPQAYLLLWDSTFTADDGDFWFGDQEEMGLGARVASPLAVDQKKGGALRDAAGRTGSQQIFGKQAAWCDYSGTLDGRHVGITLMASPQNFGASWCHVRDYGVMMSNPFGRKAYTGGEASRVTVRRGESLRLRFGVLLHGSPDATPPDLEAAYREFVKELP